MSNRYLDQSGRLIPIKKKNMEIQTKNEALMIFELLGIKDVSSKRQVKNGTTVYELPIKWMNSRGEGSAVKYATYESGYVRNVSPWNSTAWQINKRYETKEKHWSTHCKKYFSNSRYKRVLINNEEDRLVYLANYVLKNDYRKNSLYTMDEFTRENISDNHYDLHKADNVLIASSELAKLKRTQWEKDNGHLGDEISVIINGHRYNLS
tara:strand:+ start:2892 stop:3515 length:624 start_codon:yes stop_codon:yes gene_type:complete